MLPFLEKILSIFFYVLRFTLAHRCCAVHHIYLLFHAISFTINSLMTHSIHSPDNNESEYFSETLAAESLPHYQPVPQKETPSPTNSPYSSVDATNQANNNGQQSNLIASNPKYHQPPIYNGNTQINGNGTGVVRNNVVMSASIPSGGVSASSAMQQQLQQKYYDQYENFRAAGNGNVANGNGNGNVQQNGMTQSAYNGTKAYEIGRASCRERVLLMV